MFYSLTDYTASDYFLNLMSSSLWKDFRQFVRQAVLHVLSRVVKYSAATYPHDHKLEYKGEYMSSPMSPVLVNINREPELLV